MDAPIIITKISRAAYDTLTKGHPYIPSAPRTKHSLAMITEGVMRYRCGGETVMLSCGDVLFIRAGSVDIAETASEMPVSYITLDFTTQDDGFLLERRHKNAGRLMVLFARISEKFEMRSPDWMMESIGILYTILTELRRAERDASRPDRYDRIAPAMELIRKRLSDPCLTVAELADACGTTTVTLNRYFHRLYGMPVSRYITDRRMEKAKDLLLNSANTVGDVAKCVGFNDIYSFSHAFARTVGVSPSAFKG